VNIDLSGELYSYKYLPDYEILIIPHAIVTKDYGDGLTLRLLEYQYVTCCNNPDLIGTFYTQPLYQMEFEGLEKVSEKTLDKIIFI
jgi:hypothetical protein